MTTSVVVCVAFSGQVNVTVADDVSEDDACLLARRLALSRVVATVDNPDAPDEQAFDEYLTVCSPEGRPTAERDWDASTVDGVGGAWKLGSDDTFAALLWRPEDVQSLFDCSYDDAYNFLTNHQNQIRDRLCELGFEVIQTLGDMAGLKPRKEDDGEAQEVPAD